MAGIEMASTEDTVPGLERLAQLETVILNQLVSHYKGNSYAILNEEEVLFNLVEEKQKSAIFSGGNRRGFHMDGVDSMGKKVFSLRRPGMSMSDKIEISMNEELVSVVRMERTCLTPVFSINDGQDVPHLRLKCKLCTAPQTFRLKTMNKTLVGSVVKKNRGWVKEMTSRNDDYIVSFPADLAVHFKLAVVVAAVLIDFRFHEFRRN